MKKIIHKTNKHFDKNKILSDNKIPSKPKMIIIGTFLLLFILYLAKQNRTQGDIFIDKVLMLLKTKFGITQKVDPLKDFIFVKNTPNYNAYSADKKSGGNHRLLIEKDGKTMEIKFHQAENTAKKTKLEKLSGSSKARLIEEGAIRRVLFKNFIKDTDINYKLSGAGINQEIIIKNKENLKNHFTFNLIVPDFIYKDLGQGVWYFTTKEKKEIMRIPKGFIKDSKGAFSNDVGVQIKTILFNTKMTIIAPLGWIEDRERTFPLTIYSSFEIVPDLRKQT